MAWLTADVGVYFAPEEVADVFGCFFLKDIEIFNVQTGSTVDLSETANRGDAFLAIMTPEQRKLITDVADSVTETNKGTLWKMKEIRTAINSELRKLMTSAVVDEKLLSILHYQLGFLDGSIISSLAHAFAKVYWNMSEAQKVAMRALRDPTRPQTSCPNNSTQGGTWILASPLTLPLVQQQSTQQMESIIYSNQTYEYLFYTTSAPFTNNTSKGTAAALRPLLLCPYLAVSLVIFVIKVV